MISYSFSVLSEGLLMDDSKLEEEALRRKEGEIDGNREEKREK